MSMTETEQESAFTIISNFLSMYDLESLAGEVRKMVFDENIYDQNILEGRIRGTQQFRDRFKANETRIASGLPALSPDDYINMENTFAQFMRNSGLPANFYDSPDDFQTFIANNVSTAELQQRISNGYEAVRYSDPEVINQMKELYGIGENELAAYFLDPERARPILMRQAAAAQTAAGARLAGGQLSREEAETLALAGVDLATARQGFQAIEQSEELFGTTTEEQMAGEQAFTREEQIGATFGTSGAAQQRVRQRVRRRQAQFQQGGGFAGQGAELSGLQ